MEGENTKVLLVSANLGSIFEDPEHMLKLWLKEFLKSIQLYEPGLLALHCQEVGGKNYEASMQHVNQFVKTLLGCEQLQKYDRARVFLDEDFTAADKFTALGNLYFIHEAVADVFIWDYIDCKFITVEGREVLSGNIENIQIKEKAKFPQHFFPEFKWSRKGFLRTRWNINNCVFDLVNIHLFHDASNIVAMQSSPSLYCGNRKQAMMHTLQRFENDQYEKFPCFVFGDFNFRLDSKLLVQKLTEKTVLHQTKGKKEQISKLVYTEEESGKPVLTMESKGFDHHERHAEVFSNMGNMLSEFDIETAPFRDRLYEYEINFPPSYPFSEDINDGLGYMKTRVPSWCDRILLTHSCRDIIVHESKHKPIYDLIGKESCMGDHKPVILFLYLKKGKGNLETPALESPTKSRLEKTTSVNGEDVSDMDIAHINIHDYAYFENHDNLLPEFRRSVKLKVVNPSEDPQKPSFQQVARQVVSIENVLLQWRGRPRSRHHSSSSEDMQDDDAEQNNNLDGPIGAEGVQNLPNTSVSNSSQFEKDTCLPKNSGPLENTPVTKSVELGASEGQQDGVHESSSTKHEHVVWTNETEGGTKQAANRGKSPSSPCCPCTCVVM